MNSNLFQFLRFLGRVSRVIIFGYLFYNLIISKSDIFLDIQSFIWNWALFYALCSFVVICEGFIIEERHPKSYIRKMLRRLPIYFVVVGIFIYNLMPYILSDLLNL